MGKTKPSRKRIRERTQELRRRIARMDFVASGTMHERTKVCGRKNCKCASDPAERHGPYYEWSRRKDGKLHHRIVTPEQAELLKQSIANHRQIQALLAQWEDETAEEILNPSESDALK
jgi:hypothetical protein